MNSIPAAVYDDLVKKYGINPDVCIKEPADILQIKQVAYLTKKKQEHMIVISLDAGSNVIKSRVITVGTLNHSLVHPREIFRDAISDNAHSIICVHNHPSGNLDPSSADIGVTKQLKEAGDIIGINLLDHIIVSKLGIQSLRGLGYV